MIINNSNLWKVGNRETPYGICKKREKKDLHVKITGV